MSGTRAGCVPRARVRALATVLIAAAGLGSCTPAAVARPVRAATGGGTGAEVPALRTEFSQTRRLAGGVYETTLSSRAVNFKDAAGKWRRIDNELVASADGELKNGAAGVEIGIPRTARGDVRFADGGDAVSFGLVGAAAAPVEVEGATARFQDAAEDVDLEYEAAGNLLKETLTLASPSAPATYRFDVDAGGLRSEVAPSGDVIFVDADGRRRLGFAAPWMKDADGRISRGARYEVEQADGKTHVVLRLDQGWLNDSVRRYPVVVDPTVYSGLEHVCEIRSGARSSTTYCDGSVSDVWVGKDANGILHRSLFELEDLNEAVPAYGQVLDSWFAVYLNGQNPVEASDVDLHHLTSGFAPGATWTRSDGRRLWGRAGGDFDPQRIYRASTGDADPSDGWLAFDVTPLARALVAGTEPSPNLLLKAADETRTHIDSFDDAEIKVRWTHRTGISPLNTYETRTLSDGSTLSMNVANGNLVLASNDIDLESDDGRFTVGRFFNSLNLANDETTGSFGPGSRGDFGSIRLDHHWLNDSYIFSGPGAETGVFDRRPDGTFTPPAGMDAVLTELSGGGATIVFNDSTETWTFDADGRLVQTRQDYGYTIDGTYGPDGLATLRDSAGHTATFGYDGNGDLRTITDQDSAVHRYDYDSNHRLTAYTSPAGGQTRYTYDTYNRLVRIDLPDRTALRIVYYGNGYMPYSLTTVNAAGIDQPATRYSGELDWTQVVRPADPRRVYFFDPATLAVDLMQTGDDAAISTSGPIPSLDGGFTRGDTTLTVDVSAAQVPAGIQLTELEVDDVEVDSVGAAPCDAATCPTRARETLAYDPTTDAEGVYEYRVNTVDGDDERTNAPLWRIGIDRTGPTVSAVNFGAAFEPDTNEANLEWDPGYDPQLADGSPGSGVATFRVRYQRDGGGWSTWNDASVPMLVLPASHSGESIDIEVQAIDRAGNSGTISTATLTARAVTWSKDDPGPLPARPRDFLYDPNQGPGPEGDDPPSLLLSSSTYRETLCSPSNNPCGEYRPQEAAAYAMRWWNRRNPAYRNYGDSSGVDCTNFVSQALRAGNLRYMRARGYNSANGNGSRSSRFLTGEGSWWAYYKDAGYPEFDRPGSRRYRATTSFVRSVTLYEHLLDYGLARRLASNEAIKPGDVIFYNWHGTDPSGISHAQIIAGRTSRGVTVAQHSIDYVLLLSEVLSRVADNEGTVGTDWDFWVLRPRYTAANIG